MRNPARCKCKSPSRMTDAAVGLRLPRADDIFVVVIVVVSKVEVVVVVVIVLVSEDQDGAGSALVPSAVTDVAVAVVVDDNETLDREGSTLSARRTEEGKTVPSNKTSTSCSIVVIVNDEGRGQQRGREALLTAARVVARHSMRTEGDGEGVSGLSRN